MKKTRRPKGRRVFYTFARDILTLARESEKDRPQVTLFDRLESIKRYKGRQEKGWET